MLQTERDTQGAALMPINELMCLLRNDGTVDINVHSNKTHGDRERTKRQRICHKREAR